MTIFVNEREVKFTIYPNGELIVPELDIEGSHTMTVQVRLHWTGDEDIVRLALIRGLINQCGRFVHTVLSIDYMPYSRMDREQDGHCFSLKYVCQLINHMSWDQVFVVEPHSNATIKLLAAAEPIWATAELTPKAMDWMGFDNERDYLVLPDAGALKRYSKLMGDLINSCHVVVLKKKRDFGSGKIQGLEIDHTILRGLGQGLGRPRALIIDDLSSRGGTFVAAAELLREQFKCESVALLVTHMEPVGLTGDLPTKLDRVFCTDTMTFPRPVPANFEVFQRSDWL